MRPCVPLLGEAQNLCFCTILSEISENHLCILQYLAPVALKTHHKIYTFPLWLLRLTLAEAEAAAPASTHAILQQVVAAAAANVKLLVQEAATNPFLCNFSTIFWAEKPR